MTESNLSRREFLRGLTAGGLAAGFLPAMQGAQRAATPSLPPLFDCNKSIGPGLHHYLAGYPDRPDFPDVADLLRHLDRLGIDRALVWHTDARDKDPIAGNERLIRELESAGARGRLFPSFVINPAMLNDAAMVDRFVELATRHRIRAFHYRPHRLGPSILEIAPVLRRLLPSRPALFLSALELTGKPADLPHFAAEFSQVPIVFCNAQWTHFKRIFPLMAERPNVRIEMSLIHTYRTVEDLIQRFGPDRILFGNGWRSHNGASIASLAHTEASSAHLQQIAHGNLEGLLGVEKPLRGSKPITGERLWHRLLRREHLNLEMMDAHGHMSPVIDWKGEGAKTLDLPKEHALRYMDGMGVRTQIVAEFMDFYSQEDLATGTPVEKALGGQGHRFRGYLSGRFFTQKNANDFIPLLDKVFARPYYAGFKTHASRWNVGPDDPCFEPLWKFADARRLPVLLHTWTGGPSSPERLRGVVARYPGVSFLLAHSGNTERLIAEELVRNNPNVYLEFAGSYLNPSDWRGTIERVGNHRIVWGSDGISWDDTWGHSPAWELGRLLSIDGVSDETLHPILGANLSGILARRKRA